MSLMSFIAANGGSSVIKSIQRGESNIGSLTNLGTSIAIATVDPTKTMIFITGMRTENDGASLPAAAYPTVLLNAATTGGGYVLRFQRSGSGFSGGSIMATGNVFVSWQVVEFK